MMFVNITENEYLHTIIIYACLTEDPPTVRLHVRALGFEHFSTQLYLRDLRR
jgi:hypothetical protein